MEPDKKSIQSIIPNVRLKEARESRGLTQNDVADLLNVPNTRTIGRWERGESIPHPRYRRELCRIFDKNMEELGFLKTSIIRSNEPKLDTSETRENAPLLNVFISYAHEDQSFLEELSMHLRALEQLKYIRIWYDAQIIPGEAWDEALRQKLRLAHVFLFLISSDFLGSDNEISYAMERYATENAVIIPIIVRSCLWQETPLAQMQALPRNARPVTSWSNRDEAWSDVVQGIRRVFGELLVKTPLDHVLHPDKGSPARRFSQIYQFDDVFVKSGAPSITFVESKDFKRLKLALGKRGRGAVIEGPSGIGKTTAIKKAIESMHSPEKIVLLSARNPQDLQHIQTLETWHQGIVIIDDFHRLDEFLRQRMADYLKYLADTEPEGKKLVIIGIPHTRQRLVSISFDLATRIDIFNFGRVDDDTIQNMIEQGEEALNIRFDRHAEIIRAANGSLNIAQYICWNICSDENIVQTCQQTRSVQCQVSVAVADVMKDLSTKFGETLHSFAAMGGPKNAVSLRLIEELARCEDGYLSLSHLQSKRPELATGIHRFLQERWMETLYRSHPDSQKQLFFDQMSAALVADDPQLLFYLSRLRLSQLAKEVGKVVSLAQRKVCISYSHKDEKWLRRLQVHLKPLEGEGLIDLWDDTKIAAGVIWRDKIQEALETSRVALVLVSADFLASDFIGEHELPALLSRAVSGGTTIIPVILSPCLFAKSGLERFKAINLLHQPLTSLDYNEQEHIFVQIAEAVSERLETEEA